MASPAEVLEFEVRLKDFMTKELKRLGVTAQTQTRKAEKGFQRVDKAAKKSLKVVKQFMTAMAAGTAIMTFVMSIKRAVQVIREFDNGMAEVRTILDETTLSFQFAREQVLELAYSTGRAGKEIAKGLYQTLSAGITDGADAMLVLNKASDLAISGLATVNETVDILTSAVNAFGIEVTDTSINALGDLFQATVRLGKTTIPELSHSLGTVMPVASNLGVSLEELSAMLGALTLGGMRTDLAATQLRQTFAQLLHPSVEAKKVMKEYNVQISAARVRQEGFLPVLRDLNKAFDGNAVALRTIFPNIRALVGVMALAGNQFDDVGRIMDQFSRKNGEVDRAVEKMKNSLEHKMKLLESTWGAFWFGVVGEMRGAVDEMTAAQIEAQVAANRAAGKQIGQGLAPIVDIAKVAGLEFVLLMQSLTGSTEKEMGETMTVFFQQTQQMMQGIGMEVSDQEKMAVRAMQHMVNLQKRMAASARESKEAQDLLTRSTKVYSDAIKKLGDIVDTEFEGGLGVGNLSAKGVSALREIGRLQEEASEKGVEIHLHEMDRVLLQELATSDKKKKIAQNYYDWFTKMSGMVADMEFQKSVGYVYRLTEEKVDAYKKATEHEQTLFKFQTMSNARNLEETVDRIKQQATLHKMALRNTEDAYLAELQADEDFLKLSKAGQQERLTLEVAFSNRRYEVGVEAYDRQAKEQIQTAKKADRERLRSAKETHRAMERDFKGLGRKMLITMQEFSDKAAEIQIEKFGFAIRDIKDLYGTELAEGIGEKMGESMGVMGGLFSPTAQQELQDFVTHMAFASAEAAHLHDQGLISDAQLASVDMMVDRVRDLHIEELKAAAAAEKLDNNWKDVGATFENVTMSFGAGLEAWGEGLGTMNERVQELAFEFAEGLHGAIMDFVSGAKSAKEAFKDFAKSFLLEIMAMILKQMLLNTLMAIYAAFKSVTMLADGGTVPGGTGELMPLANGGVVSGGLGRAIPVKGYANGGPIVSSPHVALIGEGQHNEAVVPLPDGRSIPVQMQGGGGGADISVNIQAVDAKGVNELLFENQNTLRDIVRQAMQEDYAFRSALGRG